MKMKKNIVFMICMLSIGSAMFAPEAEDMNLEQIQLTNDSSETAAQKSWLQQTKEKLQNRWNDWRSGKSALKTLFEQHAADTSYIQAAINSQTGEISKTTVPFQDAIKLKLNPKQLEQFKKLSAKDQEDLANAWKKTHTETLAKTVQGFDKNYGEEVKNLKPIEAEIVKFITQERAKFDINTAQLEKITKKIESLKNPSLLTQILLKMKLISNKETLETNKNTLDKRQKQLQDTIKNSVNQIILNRETAAAKNNTAKENLKFLHDAKTDAFRQLMQEWTNPTQVTEPSITAKSMQNVINLSDKQSPSATIPSPTPDSFNKKAVPTATNQETTELSESNTDTANGTSSLPEIDETNNNAESSTIISTNESLTEPSTPETIEDLEKQLTAAESEFGRTDSTDAFQKIVLLQEKIKNLKRTTSEVSEPVNQATAKSLQTTDALFGNNAEPTAEEIEFENRFKAAQRATINNY